MKGLFYLSGIVLVFSLRMLIRGLQHQKRKDIIIGSMAGAICMAYAGYYIFYVD